MDDEGALDPRVPDLVAGSHRSADRAYVEMLREEAPATIRFLEDRGVELVHYPLGLATSITGGREAAPKGRWARDRGDPGGPPGGDPGRGDQTTAGLPNLELMNATDLPPVTADTIGELGSKLGLDPGALEATVARTTWPPGRSRSFDPFTRDRCATHGLLPPKSNWAFRLDTPPVPRLPADVRRDVHVRRGAHGHAGPGPDARGNGDPRLYAAGEVTGLYYHRYPVGTSVLRS